MIRTRHILTAGVGMAVALFLLSFVASGCAKPIANVPAAPAVVLNAEQDVKAGAAKALGVLLSASKVARTLGQIESLAVADGVVPASVDTTFDSIMVNYANASDRAVNGILTGVESWDRLKALVDPVIAEVNRLIDVVNSLGALKSKAGEWAQALKDIVLDAIPGLRPTAALRPVVGGVL